MARKKKPRRRKDWRMILFFIVSLIIALTMVLAYVIPALN